jgi:hypothetical protein
MKYHFKIRNVAILAGTYAEDGGREGDRRCGEGGGEDVGQQQADEQEQPGTGERQHPFQLPHLPADSQD